MLGLCVRRSVLLVNCKFSVSNRSNLPNSSVSPKYSNSPVLNFTFGFKFPISSKGLLTNCFTTFFTFLISSPSFWENLGSSFTEEKIVAAVNTVFTTPRVARWLFSPLSLLFRAFSHSSEVFPVPTVRITSPSIGKNSLGLSPIWSFISLQL